MGIVEASVRHDPLLMPQTIKNCENYCNQKITQYPSRITHNYSASLEFVLINLR